MINLYLNVITILVVLNLPILLNHSNNILAIHQIPISSSMPDKPKFNLYPKVKHAN